MKKLFSVSVLSIFALAIFTGVSALNQGCDSKQDGAQQPSHPCNYPKVTLANSKYTSWNTYYDAANVKIDGKLLVDPRPGYAGILEDKWGVDYVMQDLDYAKSIEVFGASQADAVCMTTMDAVQPSASRKSVVVMPHSTSYGADGFIVADRITSLEQCKSETLRLLEKSVSEYVFSGCLEQQGLNPKDFKFVSMDPEAIAPAMQQKQKGFDAAMLWNPLLRAALKTRKDCRVMFDSTMLPGHIVDSLVVGQDYLDKPEGKNGACLLIDIYYTMCKRLADPATSREGKLGIGAVYGGLEEAAVDDLVRQTRFYATPEQGIALFTDGVAFPWPKEVKETTSLFTNANFNPQGTGVTDKKLKDLMPLIAKFCVEHEMTDGKQPAIGFGTKQEAPDARLRLDPTYMKLVAEKN